MRIARSCGALSGPPLQSLGFTNGIEREDIDLTFSRSQVSPVAARLSAAMSPTFCYHESVSNARSYHRRNLP